MVPVIKGKIANLVYAFLIDAIIVFILFYWISFGGATDFEDESRFFDVLVWLIIVGIVSSLIETFVLVRKVSEESFIYSWASLTGLLNIYIFTIAIQQQYVSNFSVSDLEHLFWPVLFDLLFIYGGALSIYMTYNLFARTVKL